MPLLMFTLVFEPLLHTKQHIQLVHGNLSAGPIKVALCDQPVLQQAIAGMLSSTLTPSRSRVVVPVPLVKDTVGGYQRVALERTFAI